MAKTGGAHDGVGVATPGVEEGSGRGGEDGRAGHRDGDQGAAGGDQTW